MQGPNIARARVRFEWEALPPSTVRTDNALKIRFSATVGEDPDIELALV
ncbi:MAG: hypothetical protein H0X71_06710 [Rubrobacter sp.]|nr:hypothetical protein [Rubrobacter sp.]